MPVSPSALSLETLLPLERAVAVMRVLRSPAGCPWDREQTMQSLQRYTLEEVYEVFDAIDREAWDELQGELGDLLLQVLFYAQIAQEEGRFGIEEVAAGLSTKLLRRHPHVFGEGVAEDAAAVVATWEAVKREERRAKGARAGALGDVPRGMPALLQATKLTGRAAKVGFDWPDTEGVLRKLEEELGEVEAERAAGDMQRMEEELGDVLFTAVNLARHMGVDAEQALRGANERFRRRFEAMEERQGERIAAGEVGAEEWERLWTEAKARVGEGA